MAKKIGIMLCILIGIVLLVYFITSMYFASQINSLLVEAKKGGEIVSLAERKSSGELTEENRAFYYINAGALVNLSIEELPENPQDIMDYYNKYEGKIEVELINNQKVLTFIEQARDCKKCNFCFEYSEGFEMNFPGLAGLRSVSQLLTLSAISAIANENYEEALEKCRQNLLMGKDVNDTAFLYSYTKSLAIMENALKPLEYMGDNNINADYKAIIKELEEINSAFNENMIKTLETERASGLELYRKILTNQLEEENGGGSPILTYIGKPYVLADELYYLKYMNKMIGNVKKENSSHFKQDKISKYYMLSNMLIPDFNKVVERKSSVIEKSRNVIERLKNRR